MSRQSLRRRSQLPRQTLKEKYLLPSRLACRLQEVVKCLFLLAQAKECKRSLKPFLRRYMRPEVLRSPLMTHKYLRLDVVGGRDEFLYIVRQFMLPMLTTRPESLLAWPLLGQACKNRARKIVNQPLRTVELYPLPFPLKAYYLSRYCLR